MYSILDASIVYVRILTLVFLYYLYVSRTRSGLPDAASKEAASWVTPDNDRTILIDASTAFRTADDWTYGFPGTLCGL
jgi:hypothetical protein